jgi:hypothetical protein
MTRDEYDFFVWFDDNCLTLGKMHEQYLKDNPTDQIMFLDFINHIYDHGQDVVKDWGFVEKGRAISNN